MWHKTRIRRRILRRMENGKMERELDGSERIMGSKWKSLILDNEGDMVDELN